MEYLFAAVLERDRGRDERAVADGDGAVPDASVVSPEEAQRRIRGLLGRFNRAVLDGNGAVPRTNEAVVARGSEFDPFGAFNDQENLFADVGGHQNRMTGQDFSPRASVRWAEGLQNDQQALYGHENLQDPPDTPIMNQPPPAAPPQNPTQGQNTGAKGILEALDKVLMRNLPSRTK